MWEAAKHDTPFGHCAKCRQDLPIHTGGDGKFIVSGGFCRECDLMTVWEVADAT